MREIILLGVSFFKKIIIANEKSYNLILLIVFDLIEFYSIIHFLSIEQFELLKKINRHTSKEKIFKLVHEHRFECLHMSGGEWYHRSSMTILDPAMKGQWYEHPMELYDELVAKINGKIIAPKKKSQTSVKLQ